MALGAASATLPVLVHFLTRPRPVRMPLSTIRFVREAIREQKARHRLRDFIILALRTTAILLIALALARPQWGARPLVSDQEEGASVRVVVVDVSQSMAATHGGLANIERARTAAADFLRYRRDLRANLILAGATPRCVFEGTSTNFGALGESLAHCRALPERLNLNRTLEKAATMLAPTGPQDQRRREFVVISDFQRSGWAAADLSALPADTRIQFVSVAPPKQAVNLAVVRAEFRGRTSQERGAQIEVEGANYGDTTRPVAVEVTLGGATTQLSGVCPPGRRTTLAESVQIPQTGWQTGSVRLVGNEDALVADDVRPLVTDVRPKPRYVLITREPKERRPSSSHFLECALVPDVAMGPKAAAELLRLDPSVADRDALAPADLVALDHPGKLPEKTIQLIAELMRRGRPVLYITAEAADAVNLKRLVDAAGGGSRMPVEFSPPQAASPRRDLFLSKIEKKRPPFNVFGDAASDLTSSLRFSGGLGSRRTTSGLEDDVLATYGDGSACLVLTSFGNSTLAVLNADLGASNLPRTGPFVPLLDEVVQELLNRGDAGEGAVCGEPLVRRLPAEVSTAVGLKIRGTGELPSQKNPAEAAPADESAFGKLVDEAAGVVWQWQQPDIPGAYAVERNGQAVFAATVSIPAEESQLETLSAEVLKTRLGGGRNVGFQSAAGGEETRDNAWTWLLAGCLGAMLVEIGALITYRT